MKLKRHSTAVISKETCGFFVCFLLVFFSVSQILALSHRSSFINATVEKRQVEELSAPGDVKLAPTGGKINPPQPTPRHASLGNVNSATSRAKARVRLQNEIRRMEKSLTLLVRQNPMPPEDASAHFMTEVSVIQLKEMIRKSEKGLVKPFQGNRSSGYLNSESEGESSNGTASHHDAGTGNKQAVVPSAFSSSSSQNLKFLPERGVASRDVLNDVPSHHFQVFDRSEEYNLEQTVLKSLTGEEAKGPGHKRDASDLDTFDWETYKDLPESTKEGTSAMCPEIPQGLVGPIPDVKLGIEVDIEQIIKAHADIKQGEWKPSDCVSRHRLAIVVPYRDRWSHLKVLLHYLLPILKRQQIHFRVFVVEQHGNQTFNKGRIMNAAYREAMKLFNFHCVIFHDVDLVPEDDRNMYTCAEQPKHMSTAIDKFGYMLPYQGLVGGVLSFRAEHFQTVNGYSNMYWGWGGEDDDMTVRILHRGLRIFRPPSNVARYKMVKHGSRQLSELRLKLLRTAARRSRVEGLNNVPYQLMFTHLEKLFTHFMVDVGKP